ncbi:MAG: ion transporter [Deltaproteobacteria bacterium]|jgi:hypothetical protein|nr:ion transporter [Deltaproteobacteria bacterium]MBW2537356.1 ion transporter [Deltaproteobacteria bacterium]
MDPPRPSRSAEWFRDQFSSDLTKLGLSLIILVSVLPFDWIHRLSWAFFAFFAAELYGRATVLRDDLRRRSISRIEFVFLVIDVIAVLSFLPLEAVWDDMRLLRLFRLARMLLLLGYWGPMAREIWTILAKRERRFQLFFVGAAVVILSFVSAVLLFHFAGDRTDFNGDGDPTNDRFGSMLWWSFRQVEDPGNLLADPSLTAAFVCSVVLTLSGLFVFTFLIGIANSVVEELVRVARERRLGFRRHSVICNIDEYSRFLLEELVAYYTKGLRTPRIITMGAAENRYHYMYDPTLRRIRYRPGRPLSVHDLEKVDTDRARRVILRGYRDREASDSEIVSQVLSVRQFNPSCTIVAELFRRDNVHAALEAGERDTIPILTNQFVGRFLAKILVFPGVEDVHTELLSSAGVEIYSCLYGYGTLQRTKPPADGLPKFGSLLDECYRAHGVVLLGYLLTDDSSPSGLRVAIGGDDVDEGLKRALAAPEAGELRGFFGLAPNFDQLGDFVASLPFEPRPPAAVADGRAVPKLGLCPVATKLDKVLVCGFHDGLVDTCVQLFFYTPALHIFILVPDEEQVEHVVTAFAERPLDGFSEAAQSVGMRFAATGPGEVTCESDGHRGAVHVFTGDWSKEHTMLEHRASGYRLDQMDAVVFTYTPGESDPDARTALGLLKLIRLQETRGAAVRSDLRVLCEVQSTEKAELLHKRFARSADGKRSTCHPLSVVSTETIRDAMLAQAVLIPGIAAIFRNLLGEGGPELCKLRPVGRCKSAPLTFAQLLAALYERDRLILVAVELEDDEGHRSLVSCPEPGAEGSEFDAAQVVGVVAVGDPSHIAPATQRCSHCFAKR